MSSILIACNDSPADTLQNNSTAQKLKIFFQQHGREVKLCSYGDDKRVLRENQWVILVYTNGAEGMPISGAIDTAMQWTIERKTPGVFAVTTDNATDLPSKWLTIRTYRNVENPEEGRNAQESIEKRILQYEQIALLPASRPAPSLLAAVRSPFNRGVQPSQRPITPVSAKSSSWSGIAPARVEQKKSSPRRAGLLTMLVVGIPLVSLVVGFLALFVTHNSAIGTHTASSPGTHRTATGQIMTTQPAAASPSDTTSPQYWMRLYNATIAQQNPSFTGFRQNDQWDNDGNSCSLKSGSYEVFASPQDGYQPCFANNTNFKNFAYQVTMNIPAGAAGGVIFRADSKHAAYYRVSITPSSTPNGALWSALVCTPQAVCTHHNTSDGQMVDQAGATIPQNQPVMLTVIIQDTTIALYANDNLLNHFDDPALSAPGQIGVYAAGFSSQKTVTFSNLKFWSLDSAK